MTAEIREYCDGTALALIVDGRTVATAKKTPRGWTVRSRISKPWKSPKGAIRPDIPTNVIQVESKRMARIHLGDALT